MRDRLGPTGKQFFQGNGDGVITAIIHMRFALRSRLHGFTILFGSLLIAGSIVFAACQKRVVVLQPGENDLVVLNGCVISACNYLAVVETQHSLEKNFWAKILLVRYQNHPAGHAYCVWETDGNIYGYDRNAGSFPIPSGTREPRQIASVLAEGLSKSLNERLLVAQAEFVEPRKAQLHKF